MKYKLTLWNDHVYIMDDDTKLDTMERIAINENTYIKNISITYKKW